MLPSGNVWQLRSITPPSGSMVTRYASLQVRPSSLERHACTLNSGCLWLAMPMWGARWKVISRSPLGVRFTQGERA